MSPRDIGFEAAKGTQPETHAPAVEMFAAHLLTIDGQRLQNPQHTGIVEAEGIQFLYRLPPHQLRRTQLECSICAVVAHLRGFEIAAYAVGAADRELLVTDQRIGSELAGDPN